ncbi:sensor histidine kinase [Streptacidiphilus sp. P02-A3a]|uniref:sensor histidine kinase n=1 Tax=Streptacidiphilus sp. P02-A3a TaxID=2704468 RepID=UPI0015FCC8EF|nr:sensor histidine kinase [Streptacidiphilus sp. P02-A3a]QMU73004.1 sensor histidine kinase [Streptacidiphilus sp. P02-A3a]
MQTMYSWFRRHPMVADAAWAALLFLLCALVIAVNWDNGQLAFALMVSTVVLCSMLVIRRSRPDLAVWVGIGTGLVQVACGSRVNVADFALLLLAYTAAAFAHVWTSRAALIAGLAAGPLAWLRFYGAHASPNPPPGRPDNHVWIDVIMSVVFSTPFLLCWVLGRLTRIRRAYYVQLEDRAARLERERDAQAKIAVAAERARIARELHDVVAHNVSVMIVQADGASFVMDSSPEQARQALATIAGTGRQALEEMRRLLGLLRSADSGGEYLPQPGVEQLPDLLDQVRNAGLPVVFEVEGEPRELPRGVELTAYRIVQEALTNARKHGGPRAAARVRIRFDDRGVDVLIEDDGRGATAQLARDGGQDGFGHGLIGMRERVGMVGGTLNVGPGSNGGFRIDARLPLKPTRGKRPEPAPVPPPESAPEPAATPDPALAPHLPRA